MKKINVFILLLIMFLPVVVNAKEGCSIVSGNGKDIGSEIACGSEHFYIVENKNDQVKMLAKYNLYVGANYNKIRVDSGDYSLQKCNDDNCNSLSGEYLYYIDNEQVMNQTVWLNGIAAKYNLDQVVGFNNFSTENNNVALIVDNYGEIVTVDGIKYRKNSIKLYPYTLITPETNGYGLQNELARGVTGEKGNANYPLYATLPIFSGYQYGSDYDTLYDATYNYDNFLNGYTNFDFNNNSVIHNYLVEYKTKLNNMGYDVSNVDMFNIKNINDLVKSITNKDLPLSNWYRMSYQNISEYEDGIEYTSIGDLKEYLSNDYKWVWNTTYWLKTIAGNYNIEGLTSGYLFFVSSAGDICYSESDCNGVPRAGLRPVVTIPKSNIKYKIFTKTDGNGTIEVVDSAFGGDSISFRVSAKKGLKLAGLTVTTDSNEKVEFSEGDITQDKSGVYSISTNKFTMPFENVTIQARWGLINPETGMVYSIIILVLLILGISTSLIIKKKKI